MSYMFYYILKFLYAYLTFVLIDVALFRFQRNGIRFAGRSNTKFRFIHGLFPDPSLLCVWHISPHIRRHTVRHQPNDIETGADLCNAYGRYAKNQQFN